MFLYVYSAKTTHFMSQKPCPNRFSIPSVQILSGETVPNRITKTVFSCLNISRTSDPAAPPLAGLVHAARMSWVDPILLPHSLRKLAKIAPESHRIDESLKSQVPLCGMVRHQGHTRHASGVTNLFALICSIVLPPRG